MAPLASLEAAKQNKRKKHRNHRSKELFGARQIQGKAAQYARELLSELPPETLGSVSITEGTDFEAAVQKNVRDLKAAIANSSWPQAAKNAAFWHLPAGLTGGGGKSGNWSGETSVGGYCFCWTRTTIFFKDPWYVIRFTVKICCTPTPTPTANTDYHLRLRRHHLRQRRHHLRRRRHHPRHADPNSAPTETDSYAQTRSNSHSNDNAYSDSHSYRYA